MNTQCPSCEQDVSVDVFYHQEALPIHSCLLLEDQAEATSFPRGEVKLVMCSFCGFIWNDAFQAERMRYMGQYEETLTYSPRFQRYQTALVNRCIERYNLKDRLVVEIGCGRGDFLLELCERGFNRGVGIDPSSRPNRPRSEAADRVQFLTEYYSSDHASLNADFVCCRHTLEHIAQPAKLLRLLQENLGQRRDVAVMFELPDTTRVLAERAFWDLYYEHCSYFTLGSLGRLFRRSGFEIVDLTMEYDNQYLLLEAKPAESAEANAHNAEETVAELTELVTRFREGIDRQLSRWRAFLQNIRREQQRAVLWGSGSKAVAFLNVLDVTTEVTHVVDINPKKQGQYLAGTGHEVVAPEFLKSLQPDLVIVMNPVYLAEIMKDLDSLEVMAEVVAL